mmetsp:Transcript_29483/g.67946  ORF Transcript_29483/g.67946 Transcript_29483/m.67946 type:complete len:224 (+) Transcript_29483:716-1387(+)
MAPGQLPTATRGGDHNDAAVVSQARCWELASCTQPRLLTTGQLSLATARCSPTWQCTVWPANIASKMWDTSTATEMWQCASGFRASGVDNAAADAASRIAPSCLACNAASASASSHDNGARRGSSSRTPYAILWAAHGAASTLRGISIVATRRSLPGASNATYARSMVHTASWATSSWRAASIRRSMHLSGRPRTCGWRCRHAHEWLHAPCHGHATAGQKRHS